MGFENVIIENRYGIENKHFKANTESIRNVIVNVTCNVVLEMIILLLYFDAVK